MEITIAPLVEDDWPEVHTMWGEAIATGHTTFTATPSESHAKFAEGKLETGRLIARD